MRRRCRAVADDAFQKWMLGLMSVLCAAGVLSSISVWANDGKQEEAIHRIEARVDKNEALVKENRETNIRVAGKLQSIDENIERLAKALEALAREARANR